MGLLFWKDNRKIDAFAQALADDLYSYVQPDVAKQHVLGRGNSKMSKKQVAKVNQKFTDIVRQMQRFVDSESFGVYGKARLQKKFNERLEELGYSTAVVNKITESFLLGGG